jgi:hypothetical protein
MRFLPRSAAIKPCRRSADGAVVAHLLIVIFIIGGVPLV